MDFQIKVMSSKDALLNEDYILPYVYKNRDFDRFVCYGAFADDFLVGVLVMDPKIYEPEILSLGVSHERKRQGFGKALLEYAVYDTLSEYDEAEGELGNRFICSVLGKPDNTAGIRAVVEHCGFNPYEDGYFYEIEVGDIKNNPHIQDDSAIPKDTFLPLKKVDPKILHEYRNHLTGNEILPGLDPDDLDEDISIFEVKNGKIVAGMAFAKEDKGVVQNLFLNIEDDSANMAQDLRCIISAVAGAAIRKFPESAKISFWTGNENTKGLLTRLFPDAKEKQRLTKYELKFEDLLVDPDDRFTDTIEFTPISNDRMVCANCSHCTKDILSCNIFQQKPDSVFDGENCKYFEAR